MDWILHAALVGPMRNMTCPICLSRWVSSCCSVVTSSGGSPSSLSTRSILTCSTRAKSTPPKRYLPTVRRRERPCHDSCLLKGQFNEIFDPQFFSSFKPDQWVRFTVKILLFSIEHWFQYKVKISTVPVPVPKK